MRTHVSDTSVAKPGIRLGDVFPAVFPQLPWALSPPDAAAGSFRTGLLCTLLASPAAQLLSLLLRLGQVPAACRRAPAVPVLPPVGPLPPERPPSSRRSPGGRPAWSPACPRGGRPQGRRRVGVRGVTGEVRLGRASSGGQREARTLSCFPCASCLSWGRRVISCAESALRGLRGPLQDATRKGLAGSRARVPGTHPGGVEGRGVS